MKRQPSKRAWPSKSALKEELVALLAADLKTLENAHEAALEGATHAEAKPENDKDTRALEQSYLARGQAGRVEEMRAGLALVQALPLRNFSEDSPVAVGALVVAREENNDVVFFVMPHGGGSRLGGGKVQVVTPKSPLGQALLGKLVGDDCEVKLAGRVRELSVTAIE